MSKPILLDRTFPYSPKPPGAALCLNSFTLYSEVSGDTARRLQDGLPHTNMGQNYITEGGGVSKQECGRLT